MQAFYLGSDSEGEWFVKARYVPVLFRCDSEDDAQSLCDSLNDNVHLDKECGNIALTSEPGRHFS